jgi:hypothetical protein
METVEKDRLNKIIRKYEGENGFILSLKKQLRNNKYLQREDFGKKEIKVLSEKQYEAARSTLED